MRRARRSRRAGLASARASRDCGTLLSRLAREPHGRREAASGVPRRGDERIHAHLHATDAEFRREVAEGRWTGTRSVKPSLEDAAGLESPLPGGAA
jgi:hypothetical protein